MREEDINNMKIGIVFTALYIVLILAIIGLAFVVYEVIKWWIALP